jgi:hypothetical protein
MYDAFIQPDIGSVELESIFGIRWPAGIAIDFARPGWQNHRFVGVQGQGSAGKFLGHMV